LANAQWWAIRRDGSRWCKRGVCEADARSALSNAAIAGPNSHALSKAGLQQRVRLD